MVFLSYRSNQKNKRTESKRQTFRKNMLKQFEKKISKRLVKKTEGKKSSMNRAFVREKRMSVRRGMERKRSEGGKKRMREV